MKTLHRWVCAVIASCLVFPAAAEHKGGETIVLAGGCFWGMEAVFEHVEGVVEAVAGYTGGTRETADYGKVSSGRTDHAEAVRVTYDPRKIPLSTLLDIYFTVAHNPTQLHFQGPDKGTQYRSAVFFATPGQKEVAETKIAMLTEQRRYDDPIVTTLEKLDAFYPAEDYHQDYAKRHSNHPYVARHDTPKIMKLKETYGNLYKEQ